MASGGSSIPDLVKLGKELKSIVLSAKSCSIITLQRDYRGLNGVDIPYRQLGYSSLEELISAVPEYIQMRYGMVEAVSTQSSAHLESLIYRTKSKAKAPSSLAPSNQQPKRGAAWSRSGRGGGVTGVRGRSGFISGGPLRVRFNSPAAYDAPRFVGEQQMNNRAQSRSFGFGPPTMTVYPMQQQQSRMSQQVSPPPQQPSIQQQLPPRMQPVAISQTTNVPASTSMNNDQRRMKTQLLDLMAEYGFGFRILFQELQHSYQARYGVSMPGATFPCGAKAMFLNYFTDDVHVIAGQKNGQFLLQLKRKPARLNTTAEGAVSNDRSPSANSLRSRSVGFGSDGVPCVTVPNTVYYSSLNPAATPFIATNVATSGRSFKVNTLPSANQVTQRMAAVRSVTRANELRTNVLGLLKERYPHGVRLDMFSDEYNQRYGCWLSPIDYGYDTWPQTLTVLVGSNYLNISDDRVGLNYDGAVAMGIRPPVVPDTLASTTVAASLPSTSEQLSPEPFHSQTRTQPSEREKHEFKQITREILMENRSGVTPECLATRFRELTGVSVERYGYPKKDLLTGIMDELVRDGIAQMVVEAKRVLFIPSASLFASATNAPSDVDPRLTMYEPTGSLPPMQQPPMSSNASGGYRNDDELAPLTVCIPVQRLPNTDRLAEFADDDYENRFALVMISHFVSPNEFYLHIPAEGDLRELKELEADMMYFRRYYDTVVDLELLGEKAQPGIFCVCFWSSKFYRCRVLYRNPEADDGVVVHLIDSGETVSVASSDLGPLLTRFCQLPSQAISAAFNDLYPPIGQEWDTDGIRNVCQELLNNSADGKLWAYIIDLDEQNRLFVDLCVTTVDGEATFFSTAIRAAQLAAPLAEDFDEDVQQLNSLDLVEGTGGSVLDLEDQLADITITNDETDDDFLVFGEIEQKRRTNPREAHDLATEVFKVTTYLRQRASHEVRNAVGHELGVKLAELRKYEIRLMRLRELMTDNNPPEDPRQTSGYRHASQHFY